jgi:hypothetical protein
MPLPRFNSGSVGRLSFEHLNELFESVERLKTLLPEPSARVPDTTIVARITGSTATGAHTWTEVMPRTAATAGAVFLWEERDGGAKSGASTDPDYDPAFLIADFAWNGTSPAPARMPNNAVVVMRKLRRKDGKNAWIILQSVGAGTTFAAKITASALTAPAAGCGGGTVQGWLYDWGEVYRTSAGVMEWTAGGRSSASLGKARNGAERDCTSGVGGAPPNGVSETNQAIANGTVVTMTLDSNGQPFFSLTNDRNITCL